MAIGTPQDLGQNSSASTPASLSITTTQNVVAHDCILVRHYCNSAAMALSSPPTDSSSNVYFKILDQHAAAPQADFWICPNALAMASGGTIFCPFPGGLRHGINAIRIPGILAGVAFDPCTINFEISTSTSCPNTVVNNYCATNEILIGTFMAGGSLGTFTPGTGFTALNSTVGAQVTMFTQYQIVSASAYTTNPNNAASWTTSVGHRSNCIGLIGACSC